MQSGQEHIPKGENLIKGVLLSFSYFSSIPVKIKTLRENSELYKSMLFSFPLVGLVLGLITILFFNFLSSFFEPLYAAIVCSIIYLGLYGFLHLEAVSDVIDGWYASLSGKDVYAIMKEPQIGAVGAIGTFSFIILKVAIISYLFYTNNSEVFLASIILSRFAAIVGIGNNDFHEKSVFANTLKKDVSFGVIFFAAVFYLSFIYFVLGIDIIVLTFLALVFIHIVFAVLNKKFGFLNGDCIGFSIEVTEVLLLNIGLFV